jgi:hypothetical protein
MTETPNPDESPEIEQVRRLLAEARHTEPMPDDVAARMDDVLAGLRNAPAAASEAAASEQAPAEKPSRTVVSLASRRRRRAAGWLVAAAALVVGGVTLSQHLPESPNSSASSAGGAADQAPTAHAEAGKTGPRDLEGRVPKALREAQAQGVVVRPHRFAVDALAGRRLLQKTPRASQNLFLSSACAAVPAGDGQVLGVTYQGARAALIYRPPADDSQVVDLYLCGRREVVRSTTLPAP